MDVFARSKKYSPTQLKKLNTCRRYLRAVTISDIATADGKRLCPGVESGERPGQSFNCYRWPRQPPKLDNDHWATWKQALNDTMLQSYSTALTLRTALGEWLEEQAITGPGTTTWPLLPCISKWTKAGKLSPHQKECAKDPSSPNPTHR